MLRVCSLLFYIEIDICLEGQRWCVRNGRILSSFFFFDDNSMKDGGYNLHFPCLICTFMRVTYRRLVVSITLHITDDLHQKDGTVQHIYVYNDSITKSASQIKHFRSFDEIKMQQETQKNLSIPDLDEYLLIV